MLFKQLLVYLLSRPVGLNTVQVVFRGGRGLGGSQSWSFARSSQLSELANQEIQAAAMRRQMCQLLGGSAVQVKSGIHGASAKQRP